MYFNKFPLMVYDIKGDENYKLLPDILKRKPKTSPMSPLGLGKRN